MTDHEDPPYYLMTDEEKAASRKKNRVVFAAMWAWILACGLFSLMLVGLFGNWVVRLFRN